MILYAAHSKAKHYFHTNLQFSRGYFENKLDDTAHGQASGTGRVDFVPNRVAVDLIETQRSNG